MLETKQTGGYPIFPNPTQAVSYTAEIFDELDQLLYDVLGSEKIVTPDMVRRDYNTLEEAVLANNWPRLKASLGKFIFLLLPTTAGLGGDNLYIEDHPNLEGRAMFVQSQKGKPHAAFLLRDNAIVRQEEIKNAVKQGYLVRTRSDIETYEAKVNDYRRAEQAFSSGAQVVSTDFYKPGNNYGTDYFVTLPNKKPLRLNPIN
jgi:hypothetical protein